MRKEKKESWSWKEEIEAKEKPCWMCRKEMYTFVDKEVRVKRILENEKSKNYYVVVPRDPHVFGHILIVLRKHIHTLKEATEGDLCALSEAVRKWSDILTEAFSDCERVYLACLNDEGHLHYHLFPVRDQQKPCCGHGLKWLGDLEEQSSMMPFDKCSLPEKKARAAYIKSIANFLKKCKISYKKK